ncbi:MAG: preprotein translocase subunit SecY [bacterium]|nr:preprotein translocase subunit SecY [bacterium]
MNHILQKFSLLLKDPNLRRKTAVTFGIILVFRIFAFLPVPAIDLAQLKALFASSQFLSLLDIFSGGTLVNFSVMALGLTPYINASIIIQLITMVIPQLEILTKEGEAGRAKINQYTRLLTIPLTLIQAVGIYMLLRNQGIIDILSPIEFFSFVLTLLAGTFIIMWLGELITENGLGNGISVIIFAGIVGRIPVILGRTISTFDSTVAISMVVFIVIAIFVIASVVFINEAVRRIPVYYARRIKGNRMYQAANNYLPLKLNQAGVIPIIFAVSFVLFPQIIGNFTRYLPNPTLAGIGTFLATSFDPSGFVYNATYFVLVVAFTFFYTIVVFNPQKISDEIQKHGGFIPGIRPGSATKAYLQSVVYRITTFGAVFLGLIAVLPALVSLITDLNNLVIGGTGILIVVSVVLETFKQIDSQLVMKNYDRFTM